MRPNHRPILRALALVFILAATACAEDAVEEVKKQLNEVKELLNLQCPAKARAALAKAEKDAAALGEFEKEKVQDDLRSLKEEVERISKEARIADRYTRQIDRTLRAAEEAVEGAKSYPDGDDDSFDLAMRRTREMISDEDNKKLLGAEATAKYERKLAWLTSELTKAKLGGWLKRIESTRVQIQEAIDGKNENASSDTVEQWFKIAAEVLAKCPADEARVKTLKDQLAKQRATFDAQQMAAAQAEIIDPAVKYWAHCKEDYLKEAEGWEAEKTPSTLRDYIRNSPPKIGCPKTEVLLQEVVARWFENDMVKTALEKFPNAPPLKAPLDEATKLREVAGAKVCAFASSILGEAEKLVVGQDREDTANLLDELTRVVSQTAKGAAACSKTLLRIQELAKRWQDEKNQGDAAQQALDKKLTDAANEVWPGFLAAYTPKLKKLDAAAALKAPAAWQGAALHFKGGARGVNLNRAGWDFEGQYDFIVEVDGVPVCGNMDQGVAEAIKAIRAQTQIEPENCEEVIGIVDGLCKAYERVKHPFEDRWIRGRQLDAVRMRIVAWKGCNVAACIGKGTNLAKLPEFKEVAVPEKGRGDR